MSLNFLRTNATASATGLFVICRHLTRYDEGRHEDDLHRALQLLRTNPSATDVAAVLSASLAIGGGLAVLRKAGPCWHVDDDIAVLIRKESGAWPRFRGELLHRISNLGANMSDQGAAPDLVRGLTWLMQLSPLSPIETNWARGPEPQVTSLALDAVERSEQWRPFTRWAVALGLARIADSATPKVLLPDATTAIEDQLTALPQAASARDWLTALRTRLAILGAPSLTSQLPRGPEWDELPPAVVLGLLKLEKSGRVILEASDDAATVVPVGLGSAKRQVGIIKVGAIHA